MTQIESRYGLTRGSRWPRCSALALAACGGAKIGRTPRRPAAAARPPCGKVNIAVNPWVGYEADAAVVAYVAKTKLGCNVE